MLSISTTYFESHGATSCIAAAEVLLLSLPAYRMRTIHGGSCSDGILSGHFMYLCRRGGKVSAPGKDSISMVMVSAPVAAAMGGCWNSVAGRIVTALSLVSADHLLPLVLPVSKWCSLPSCRRPRQPRWALRFVIWARCGEACWHACLSYPKVS